MTCFSTSSLHLQVLALISASLIATDTIVNRSVNKQINYSQRRNNLTLLK